MEKRLKEYLPSVMKKVFLFLEKCSKISRNSTGSEKASGAYPDPGGMPCADSDWHAFVVWDFLRTVDGAWKPAQRRTGDCDLPGRA